MMTLTLPYPPSLNKMYRAVNNRFLISAVGRQYKQTVATECLGKKLQPLDGDLVVTIRAFRPAKRGDLDNIQKVLFDSLQGILYHNDSQLVEIHAHRDDDKDNPRVEIEVVRKDG
jgi:crossover junction endodeoxyribonuclease RusA